MLRNFFKIAFRNFFKYKTNTFINIAGFSIGLASCILILLFVSYELSYDRFHEHADDIYRISVRGTVGGNEFNQAVTSPPMGHALMDDYPEVINFVRLQPSDNMLIRNKEIIFIENNFLWADSSFFEVFSYNLLYGDASEVLDDPHTIVLTEKLALKYFGRVDVVGETMEFEDFTPYKITGVCENTPSNSHFKFDMLASLTSLGYHNNPYWLNHAFHTYILLQQGSDPAQLKAKFPGLIKKYIGPQLQEVLGQSMDEFIGEGGIFEYSLQPIVDIHLKSDLEYEIEANGDITYVYIFSIIAIFILVIACINFMNLSTARSMTRAREVGVKKVLGSNIGQLIRQFLTESIILTSIAMGIALLLTYLFLPYFSKVAGKQFEFTLFSEWFTIPVILVTIIIVGTLAGIYPAFYLSSFEPAKVLKSSLASSGKGSALRKGLVVFQFSISIFLFISTLVVQDQLEFLQEKNLGWDKDHILVVNRAWAIENNEEAFRAELLNSPNISSFSSSGQIPGRNFGITVFRNAEAPRSEQHLLNVMTSKYNLDETFKFELIDGRYFSRDFPSDSVAVVLNESAVKVLGMVDPVGKQVTQPGGSPENDFNLNIIGVIKDFHFESLHHKIAPLLIFYHRTWPAFISLRISPDNVSETISYVEATWKKFIPDKPFEYFFMDEDFGKLYDAEMRTSKIFSSFALLAIFIACLGLFGLATFTTMQRTREIGIRKTMGATVPEIVYLLSKQFSAWVLLANIVAWPAAYYFMTTWLTSFEYRIDMNYLSFFFAGTAAFVIALLTVIYHSVKAAVANPADSLRYE